MGMVDFKRKNGRESVRTEREGEDDIKIAAAILGFEFVVVRLLACCIYLKIEKLSVSFL